ncbi:MAG TPA: ribosome recycling factor [Dehalococcoidia bacterium]|jgi:ribosome recycling factor|nr:ribosome recycling factor [Chloroflexota bacterium]MDP5878124.1 ribosome recycling factor [Dehalococcoidia bacterium]MDP7213896.1 ribosome recycling factor [Dehalococcoidia bacterium]MDP7513459.1 ribosome recycling factor [Dehalococcoidia bacterium]HCV28688.1 ribosome recycling factor [Dehalococcoidia bacterium]|tara:strand:- start:1010 stop:1567 length:558 start_codon:yes stop_codon:yes gene_type:complete
MTTEILEDARRRMQGAVDALDRDLAGYRTNRASPALVENIVVDYQGMEMPLNQLAQITVGDARMLVIQPWDPNGVQDVVRALQSAELGMNPQIDGNLIRLILPVLTEERRKDLVRQMGRRVEEAKVAARNVRRSAQDSLKTLEKDGEESQDVVRRALNTLQDHTDAAVSDMELSSKKKEEEVMEV